MTIDNRSAAWAAAAASLLASVGCVTGETARAPAASPENVPTPAMVIAPVGCRGADRDAGLESQLRVLVRARFAVRPVELAPDERRAICAVAELTEDSADEAWRPGPTLRAVVRAVAEREGARALLLPVARSATYCWNDQTVIQSGGRMTTVTNGGRTCSDGGTALAALLLGPDGSVMWRSSAGGTSRARAVFHLGGSSGGDIERNVETLLGGLSPTFVDAPARRVVVGGVIGGVVGGFVGRAPPAATTNAAAEPATPAR